MSANLCQSLQVSILSVYCVSVPVYDSVVSLCSLRHNSSTVLSRHLSLDIDVFSQGSSALYMCCSSFQDFGSLLHYTVPRCASLQIETWIYTCEFTLSAQSFNCEVSVLFSVATLLGNLTGTDQSSPTTMHLHNDTAL